jgi:hypothetical protein
MYRFSMLSISERIAAWMHKYVRFTADYTAIEVVAQANRKPCSETNHVVHI